MTYTTVKMEINPDKLWSDVPLGAKIAGSIVAVALIGASLVASVFLAGAALFGALVMMVYGALAGKGKSEKLAGVKDKVHSEVQTDLQGGVQNDLHDDVPDGVQGEAQSVVVKTVL